MSKALALLIIGFTTGFLVHAIFTPDLFTNGIFLLPQAAQEAQKNTTDITDRVAQETVITYDGAKFSRTNVRMQSSRYISILNESPDTTMDLYSSEPDLTTPRPYAFKESPRTRIDKPGQYVVADRNNPAIRMVITVK